MISSQGLTCCEEPVAYVIDAELTVINLAVLGAAFLGGENLDVLALRANPLVDLPGLGERDDPIVFAMQHEKRAFDALGDTLECELLRPFERGLIVRRTHDP